MAQMQTMSNMLLMMNCYTEEMIRTKLSAKYDINDTSNYLNDY